jgi:hypothetical protein
MPRRIIEAMAFVSFCVAADAWLTAWYVMPFPDDDATLELVRYRKPAVYHAIRWSCVAMWSRRHGSCRR